MTKIDAVSEGVFFFFACLRICENKKGLPDESNPFSFDSSGISESLLSDSNQRPRDYKSRALAN